MRTPSLAMAETAVIICNGVTPTPGPSKSTPGAPAPLTRRFGNPELSRKVDIRPLAEPKSLKIPVEPLISDQHAGFGCTDIARLLNHLCKRHPSELFMVMNGRVRNRHPAVSPNSMEPGIITRSSSAAAATTTFIVEPGSYVSSGPISPAVCRQRGNGVRVEPRAHRHGKNGTGPGFHHNDGP